ncbi:MAG: hypothetical protein JO188_14350, partial [Hyphomicrobiales bacterium]|nr:hypothetical protein [Hyphomicrobiales bacterium]
DVLASRLDTTPRKVRKMMSLRGSGRRGIDQVSDLLLALGTELDFRVERRQRAEQAPPPNEGK